MMVKPKVTRNMSISQAPTQITPHQPKKQHKTRCKYVYSTMLDSPFDAWIHPGARVENRVMGDVCCWLHVCNARPSLAPSLHRRYRLPVHVSNSAAAALLAAPTPNHDGDGDGGEDGDGERRRATDCKGDIETFLVRRPPDGAAREGRRGRGKAIVWLKYLFMALAPGRPGFRVPPRNGAALKGR